MVNIFEFLKLQCLQFYIYNLLKGFKYVNKKTLSIDNQYTVN